MCTMITRQIDTQGSAKNQASWFVINHINISYDHPFHAPFEYTLNLDFVNDDLGPGARVAVELDAASARALIQVIESVLQEAEQGGHLKPELISR